jgi:tetratricopeptide (TPR) repeat protein
MLTLPNAKGCLKRIARIVACFLLVTITSCALLGEDQRAEATAHADRGLELARSGDLASAESELRKAVELRPADPAFLSSLGTVLAMEHKLEESTEVLGKALKLAPQNLTVRRNLAANLWQLHRYAEAKRHLDIILAQKPQDSSARLLRGMVAENTEDYATAVRMLASVSEQVKQRPESMAAFARAYYHIGQKEKARSTLKDLSNHPAGSQAVFLGAQIADQMHDYSTAEHMLESIQSTFPDPTRLAYTLALVRYHQGRFEECRKNLVPLIDTGHGGGEIYNLLGWSYHKQHQDKEAVQALEDAIRVAPWEEAYHLDLVRILLAQGRLPAALEGARRAARAFPGSSPTFVVEGKTEARMGQFRDAIASYTHAIELDPANVEAALGLADAQYAAGQNRAAVDVYERALKNFPKDARTPLQYATMLLKDSEMGNPRAESRAAQLLRQSLKLDPTLAETHYQLGNLALKQGETAKGVKFLERSVSLNPNLAEAHFALSRAYRRERRAADASREMELYNQLKQTESQPSLDAPPQR